VTDVVESMHRNIARVPGRATAPGERTTGITGLVYRSVRGVTGLVDHVRHGVLPSVEALGACVRAYRDLGLRATVAPMFEDRVF
jgi:hypothetical protein